MNTTVKIELTQADISVLASALNEAYKKMHFYSWRPEAKSVKSVIEKINKVRK